MTSLFDFEDCAQTKILDPYATSIANVLHTVPKTILPVVVDMMNVIPCVRTKTTPITASLATRGCMDVQRI